MMQIDIDRMSEAELIDLNHRIVERLRFLGEMRSHAQLDVTQAYSKLRRDTATRHA